MFGKQPLKRTIQNAQRRQNVRSSQPRSSLTIGNWRFEENLDGDLIARNLETDKSVIISRK